MTKEEFDSLGYGDVVLLARKSDGWPASGSADYLLCSRVMYSRMIGFPGSFAVGINDGVIIVVDGFEIPYADTDIVGWSEEETLQEEQRRGLVDRIMDLTVSGKLSWTVNKECDLIVETPLFCLAFFDSRLMLLDAKASNADHRSTQVLMLSTDSKYAPLYHAAVSSFRGVRMLAVPQFLTRVQEALRDPLFDLSRDKDLEEEA